MAKNIHEIKMCPDCASSKIVYLDDKNQVICQDCGLIYEPLDPKAEKKFEDTHDITMKNKKNKKRSQKPE